MAWEHVPQLIQWDITSRCNLACLHCRATNLEEIKGDDLSFEQIAGILEQIKALSPQATLALAGGEPMFRKDLKDILYYVKNNIPEMNTEILSNGTLINPDNIGWLTETVNGFNISLEGASAEINDSIRGKGAFDKTVQGLIMLLEKNASVSVRMTFFHQHEDEPEKLMRFIAEMGIKGFNFRYLVPVGRACNQSISSDQYKRLCERIWHLGKELGVRVGFSDPFPELLINKEREQEIMDDSDLLNGTSVTGCSIAFTLLYINPKGHVYFCPYFPVYVADSSTGDLKKIWFENETFNSFRRHRYLLKGKCGKCEFKFACGGCRGAAHAFGDFLEEEPRCWKQVV
ncbi:MAG: putative mycofactocin radical SAM maturase MftC [Syntrophus sp. SKADARSKE-3]|nr:putative mycofactocin radical SAM maturase MftC [Syntrophus sp. SKADARSKE-3]